MKILLAVFISLFSLEASAQWAAKLPWHKNRERLAPITKPEFPGRAKTPELLNASFTTFNTDLGRSHYSIDAEEVAIMKNVRHSMRYRDRDSLRIQFDKLALFYFGQNRFSEAKWYVLRSNAIARQQNNYQGIVGSLVILADVKSNLGDFKQADADLSEAKTIASSHSMAPDLLLIEQHTKQIKLNKEVGVKYQNHYSDLL
jgi:hypothetical protein